MLNKTDRANIALAYMDAARSLMVQVSMADDACEPEINELIEDSKAMFKKAAKAFGDLELGF